MARTPIAETILAGAYAAPASAGPTLVFTAWDATLGNSFPAQGRILIVKNTDPLAAHTVTIQSVADDLGRKQDITVFSIPALGEVVFGAFQQGGWAQADGLIYVDASDILVEFASIQVA